MVSLYCSQNPRWSLQGQTRCWSANVDQQEISTDQLRGGEVRSSNWSETCWDHLGLLMLTFVLNEPKWICKAYIPRSLVHGQTCPGKLFNWCGQSHSQNHTNGWFLSAAGLLFKPSVGLSAKLLVDHWSDPPPRWSNWKLSRYQRTVRLCTADTPCICVFFYPCICVIVLCIWAICICTLVYMCALSVSIAKWGL